MYTKLCKNGIITLERLVNMMSLAPCERFGLSNNGFCIVDLSKEFTVDPSEFATMGRSCPFTGMQLNGKVLATVINGTAVYLSESFK
jgi:dihydroorotase